MSSASVYRSLNYFDFRLESAGVWMCGCAACGIGIIRPQTRPTHEQSSIYGDVAASDGGVPDHFHMLTLRLLGQEEVSGEVAACMYLKCQRSYI